jgi:hypothetical protein
MIEAALKYHEKGMSVFPVNPNTKKPLVEWKKYQTERPTIDQLHAWFDRTNNGIAIVTGKISDTFVVDFDRYKPGFSEETALRLIPDSVVAPTVKTIRNGRHMYFKNPDGSFSIGAAIAPGIDFRGEGGYVVAPPSRNMTGAEYTWEVSLDECVPPSLPDSFKEALYNKDINNIYTHGDDKTSHQVSSMSSSVINSLYNEGRRDQDIFHIANLLVKAGCEKEYLYKTLEILALNCNPPFPIKEVEEKIKSAIQRAGRREGNLTADIREWVLSSSGIFLSSDVTKCHNLSSRSELQQVSNILNRLKDEGLIEKYGNKRGQFRTLDQDEEVIDYMSANAAPYPLRLPLGIEDFVSIHPGNVIVIAGESNAGKSAACLVIAKRNCHDHKVNYMSSEMQDGAELRIRLEKFGEPLENWKKIKFTFRTDNFPDKVDPDGLNIIDYLDEGTDSEAYKMPMRIRQIADRLKGGVAVIALQKDPNKGLGFGGSGTLNRSRLYITMTRQGVLTIQKAKIWRNDNINPNGMFIKFKLVAGARFMKEGDWKT